MLYFHKFVAVFPNGKIRRNSIEIYSDEGIERRR